MTEPARTITFASADSSPEPVRLAPSTARRISHQIDRSVHGTYGANEGLRELVQLGAQQMLGAGASRDDIRRQIEECISCRPADGLTTEPAMSRRKAELVALSALMVRWADDVASAPLSRGKTGRR
jgi:hypothetical protein